MGEWDYHLTPVITICFMNFVTFGKEKDNGDSRSRKKEYDAPFRVDMILADEKTGKRLSDKMHFTFLQLPVFQKEEDECENDFERWIYILNSFYINFRQSAINDHQCCVLAHASPLSVLKHALGRKCSLMATPS